MISLIETLSGTHEANVNFNKINCDPCFSAKYKMANSKCYIDL